MEITFLLTLMIQIVTFNEGGNKEFELGVHLMPVTPGLQNIKGITFFDEERKKYFTCRSTLQALVQIQEDPLDFKIN